MQSLEPEIADIRAEELAIHDKNIWQHISITPIGEDQAITWYLGGSLPNWESTPFVVALVLEEDNPEAAERIGQDILQEAMMPE